MRRTYGPPPLLAAASVSTPRAAWARWLRFALVSVALHGAALGLLVVVTLLLFRHPTELRRRPDLIPIDVNLHEPRAGWHGPAVPGGDDSSSSHRGPLPDKKTACTLLSEKMTTRGALDDVEALLHRENLLGPDALELESLIQDRQMCDAVASGDPAQCAGPADKNYYGPDCDQMVRLFTIAKGPGGTAAVADQLIAMCEVSMKGNPACRQAVRAVVDGDIARCPSNPMVKPVCEGLIKHDASVCPKDRDDCPIKVELYGWLLFHSVEEIQSNASTRYRLLATAALSGADACLDGLQEVVGTFCR